MHPEAYAYVAFKAGQEGAGCAVLDIGGRDINGSVRGLFPEARQYVSIDLQKGEGVDLVADAARLPFPMMTFDVVVCCEVFEHTAFWSDIVAEAARVLVGAGTFIATMATGTRSPHSAYDEQPIRAHEFYENVDPARLEAVMERHFGAFNMRAARNGLDLYVVGWR